MPDQPQPQPLTDERFDSMLLAMGPFSLSEKTIINYALVLRERAERAERDAERYRKLRGTLDDDGVIEIGEAYLKMKAV